MRTELKGDALPFNLCRAQGPLTCSGTHGQLTYTGTFHPLNRDVVSIDVNVDTAHHAPSVNESGLMPDGWWMKELVFRMAIYPPLVSPRHLIHTTSVDPTSCATTCVTPCTH